MSPCMRKPTMCIGENKEADQLRSNCEADHVFVFDAQIVQSFFLNPKFQASSVGSQIVVFSCTGSYRTFAFLRSKTLRTFKKVTCMLP